ncbi:hypothetical protein DV736_g3058, partial [Chaetothyriales sp. CBS 134916]
MQGTRRLVLSKPGGAVFWNARPIFNSVEAVDMFGFYPTLNRWVKRDRTISMGWGMWYWKVFWYRSPMRPTKNPRVNLSRTARWLHANLDRPAKRPGLCLHAWELEDDDGTEGCGKAYYVTIDLDTKEILTKERIMFRTKLDRCGTLLENHIKQYHDFVTVTNERRNEWLKEERKRWPELYSVTAIASEEEKQASTFLIEPQEQGPQRSDTKMPDRVSAPGQDPAYGVHLSSARINYIVASLYPDHSAQVTEAPDGFSVHNRIYFLEIAPNPTLSSSVTDKPIHAVLKVCGQFFNHTKIQNEVAALFLLARYCPSVPVPQIIAWSEDGVTISTFNQPIPDSSTIRDERPRPWMLVTHPPGRPLTTADLDSAAGPAIIAQIAQHNASWRGSIPSVPMFGNVRFRTASTPPNSLPLHEALSIEGFLLCHRPVPGPITTMLDYYMYMLKDQIHKVMSSRPYDDIRCDLVPLVAEFIERDLLYLSCVRPNSKEDVSPVFSNVQLSPRNIFVEDGPNGQITVTGIVNFEFAAFLPEIDEFANEFIRREGDWAERHYTTLMYELARLGCRVPPLERLSPDINNKFSEQEWAEACLLWKLIDNVAPCGSRLHWEITLDEASQNGYEYRPGFVGE